MNVKFCRVLETFWTVLEMLKLFNSVYLVTIVTPQKRCVLSGKSLDFSRKYKYSNCYQISLLMITLRQKRPTIAHFQNIIFVWVGKPDFREGQAEK